LDILILEDGGSLMGWSTGLRCLGEQAEKGLMIILRETMVRRREYAKGNMISLHLIVS